MEMLLTLKGLWIHCLYTWKEYNQEFYFPLKEEEEDKEKEKLGFNHEKMKWDLEDMKAKGLIRMAVNMKFNSIIRNLKSTKEAWDELRKEFVGSGLVLC